MVYVITKKRGPREGATTNSTKISAIFKEKVVIFLNLLDYLSMAMGKNIVLFLLC